MRLLRRVPCGVQKAILPDETVVKPLRSEECGVWSRDNPCVCPQSAKVGTSHRLNYISNSVGTGLAPVRQRLPCKGSCRFFWNKKMTEGFLQNHIKSTLQSLRVAYGNPPPFTREAEMQLCKISKSLYFARVKNYIPRCRAVACYRRRN